ASLDSHAQRDRRNVRSAVNTLAHPAKLQRMQPGTRRDMLAQLHAFVSAADWQGALDTALRLRELPDSTAALARGLAPLLDDEALERLRRLETLSADERIQRYLSLWDRQGPRRGSVG